MKNTIKLLGMKFNKYIVFAAVALAIGFMLVSQQYDRSSMSRSVLPLIPIIFGAVAITGIVFIDKIIGAIVVFMLFMFAFQFLMSMMKMMMSSMSGPRY